MDETWEHACAYPDDEVGHWASTGSTVIVEPSPVGTPDGLWNPPSRCELRIERLLLRGAIAAITPGRVA